MNNNPTNYQFVTSGLILISIILVVLFFLYQFHQYSPEESPTKRAIKHKLSLEAKEEKKFEFDLVDPSQAPQAIREAIELGYKIMIQTSQHAPGHANDRLSCTNCHFAGGDTTGGKGGGISLAGVAGRYPQYSEKHKSVQDLAGRVNDCFERSLNGKALPLDSEEMLAILAYLEWISKGVPIYEKVPWLGLPHLDFTHLPNSENGKKVYELQCATCHGKDGEGDKEHLIPPVWGPNSYNDGAGMHVESTLASFIYMNMPYEEPTVSLEEAADVAAFVARQPRPHFTK